MRQIITILFLGLTMAGNAQIGQNMLVYYNFDGQVHDITGQGFDATEHNVTYVDDRFGNPNSACHFNGIDSYVEFPNVAELKTPLPVSFAFWVRYDSSSYHHQALFNTSFEDNRSTGIWFNSTSSSGQYAVNYGDGTYTYTPDTRRTFVSDAVIDVNTWHHIAIVVNSATDMQIYIDKIPVPGSYSGNGGNLVYSLTPGCLGRHDRDLGLPADYFQGSIDDIQYWARVISPAEVAQAFDGISQSELSLPQTETNFAFFNIYQNPFTDVLNFESNIRGLKSIVIHNTFGQKVFETPYAEEIEVGNLTHGIYFITAENNETKVTKKIVIR